LEISAMSRGHTCIGRRQFIWAPATLLAGRVTDRVTRLSPGLTEPAALSGKIPPKVLNVYYWPFGDHATITQIQSQAPQYNVLDYVAAIPSGNGHAHMVLNGGAEATLASELSAWRASGRLALLMVSNVGAAGTGIELRTEADVVRFTDSIGALIDAYAFQGIDWDLEDGFAQSSPDAVVSATRRLKAKYGPDFIISCVPRDYEVRNNGIWARCMKAMGDDLDLIALQEYDSVAYADPYFAQIKADYADLIEQGFPARKILLGTATRSGTSVPGGAATATVYASAYGFLKSKYGIRGAMVWQSDSDARDGWSSASVLGSALGT
jgi:hypothetical protein